MKRLKGNLIKTKKSKKELLQDIVVALIVIAIIGGMLVYAHYDIKNIVEN
jgi:hypothetical protein